MYCNFYAYTKVMIMDICIVEGNCFEVFIKNLDNEKIRYYVVVF